MLVLAKGLLRNAVIKAVGAGLLTKERQLAFKIRLMGGWLVLLFHKQNKYVLFFGQLNPAYF